MALSAIHNEQEFHVGDVVRVHQKIQEDGKTRTQVFEGMVIVIRGEGANKTVTVRRIGAGGIGVERIFPLASPLIERIEVKTRGATRRAKLYYLREKTTKEISEITKRYAKKLQSSQAAQAKTEKKVVAKKRAAKKTAKK